MGVMTFPVARKIALSAVAATMMFSLAACSTYTHADAEAHPFSVLETKNSNLFEGSEFSYVDREGNLKSLSECGRESLFEQRYCHTESGNVSFSYSTRKGRIRSATVTVDGEKKDMTCTRDGDNTMSGLYICIPNEPF